MEGRPDAAVKPNRADPSSNAPGRQIEDIYYEGIHSGYREKREREREREREKRRVLYVCA